MTTMPSTMDQLILRASSMGEAILKRQIDKIAF
jgi:hypothetical protein